MATTEKFEYDSVRSSMDSVISDKTVGVTVLNQGTQYFEDATTKGGADVAIAGYSATYMQTQWNDLVTRFDAFSKYIDGINELVEEASSNNEALEAVVSRSSNIANQ